MEKNEFLERLDGFITLMNEKLRPAHQERFSNLEYKPLEYTVGRRYARLTQNGSVVAFIDINNGDIYKPAGWKGPAKHVRGNLFNEETGGFEAFYGMESGHCFVRYLK